MEDAARIMERVRSRDAGAFELLYDQYHRLVYGVAMRVLGDPAGAEDVTQSVFLKIWSAPQLFREGNFGAWIARVARNRALDLARNRRIQRENESPVSLSESDALEDLALASIDGERARLALTRLPREQREPIELGFFGGATQEQIARQTGLPLGTIKTRMRTGLRRLRSILEDAAIV